MKEENKYFRKLWGVAGVSLGAFLLTEHIWTWGEFTFFDFIGHEWLGLLLVIGGTLINVNWDKNQLSKEIKSLKSLLRRKKING